MRGQIKVRLAIAWGLALAMRFEESLQLLENIEHDIGSDDTHEGEILGVECRTIRAVVALLSDDSRTALPLAEACLRQPTDPWNTNVASNVARFCHWKAGDLESFYATPWIPYSDDEDRWNVFSSIYRLCFQGLVEVQQLRLSAAEGYYLDAMRLASSMLGRTRLRQPSPRA